jgi:hypothetical protein
VQLRLFAILQTNLTLKIKKQFFFANHKADEWLPQAINDGRIQCQIFNAISDMGIAETAIVPNLAQQHVCSEAGTEIKKGKNLNLTFERFQIKNKKLFQ